MEWNTKCNDAFESLKRILATSSLLIQPSSGETLYLYLAMSEDAVSVILIREKEVGQCPIYFFIEGPSRSRNPISEIEKDALVVVVVLRKLKRYFIVHSIVA